MNVNAQRAKVFASLAVDAWMGDGYGLKLVSRLARRDAELDPRRHCFECKNIKHLGKCKAGQSVQVETLTNCELFASAIYE